MGYGVGDHGTAAQLLEGRHALIDEGHNFLLAQLLARLGHDVRARHLTWLGLRVRVRARLGVRARARARVGVGVRVRSEGASHPRSRQAWG